MGTNPLFDYPHPLPRGRWQDVATDALDAAGFDKYGTSYNPDLDEFRVLNTFSDDISLFRIGDFDLKAHYWGDEELHADCANYPNFIDRKTGVKVQWYKYVLRDANCNKEITFDEWCEIWERFTRTVQNTIKPKNER